MGLCFNSNVNVRTRGGRGLGRSRSGGGDHERGIGSTHAGQNSKQIGITENKRERKYIC